MLDARIKAVLRRAQPDASSRILAVTAAFGDVKIDRSAMRVTTAGVAVDLTPTELRLLLEFADHPGQALTRHTLLDRVWDYGFAGDSRIVDACVQRLRAKIETDPAHPCLIATVRGVGYRLDV